MSFFRRMRILLLKEVRQLLRDPFSLAIGIAMPMVLLLLFGYGMSLDLKNAKLGIVTPERTATTDKVLAAFRSSGFFDVHVYYSPAEADRAVARHTVDGVLYLPAGLERKLNQGDLRLLIAVNAVNANQAQLTENYVRGVLAIALRGEGMSTGPVLSFGRIWFNEANDSRYFLVPGVIVLIITLIGALLTSLVMAREYEHGNLESLFVTPVRTTEILFAKALNNFFLGTIGVLISLAAVHWVFGVPMRGSLWVILLGAGLYLLVSLGLGLLISSVTRNQYLACQAALLATFMPAFMLSGFIYEINNMPWPIQAITVIVPARYFVEFLLTALLAGNVWPVLGRDLAVLGFFAVLLLVLCRWKTPKSLEK